MTALARALAWQQYATCRETDPELFFSDAPTDREHAKQICRNCPVLADCLNDILDYEGGAHRTARYGVVAGLTPEGRRREWDLRIEAAGGEVPTRRHGGGRHRAPCGTEAAQKRHQRLGECCTRCNTPREAPQPTYANARTHRAA